MRPKLVELIPFYGIHKYFRRYFNTTARNGKEAGIANWVQIYHIFTMVIILYGLLFYIFFK
mgnify:CR=1 FL=1